MNKFFILFFVFYRIILVSQNQNSYSFPNSNPNPPNLTTDTYTRAITSINLTSGFKYGFTSGGATNLLNLSLGTNPTFVGSGYTGSGTTPGPITCNPSTSPNSSGVVGETKGSFEVSYSGAAIYKIPIYTPPGTANMEPKISINYNSQMGLGLLGKAFGLAGISQIVRSSKSPIQDGKFDGVSLSNSDVFEIDGNRLYVGSGSYGANGAMYYQEIENFYTITSHGSNGNGPQWFDAKDRDGNVYEYGNSADSRLSGKNDNTILKWFLSKTMDEFGNYILYKYNNLNGEVVIDKIEYTGNSMCGLNPYNVIKFDYMETADKNKNYIAGKEFRYTKILKSITVLAENKLVKKYDLFYDWDKQSHLVKISESDAFGNQLLPLSFCWDSSGPNLDNMPQNTGQISNYYGIVFTGLADLDGNGLMDRLYQTNNSTLSYELLLKPNTNPITYSNSSLLGSSNIVDAAVTDEDLDNKQELYIINLNSQPNNVGYKSYNIDKVTVLNNSINVARTTYNTAQYHNYNDLTKPSQVFFNISDYTGDGIFDKLIIDPETITISNPNNSISYNYSSLGQFARPFQFDEDSEWEYLIYDAPNTSNMGLKVLDLNLNTNSFSVIYSTSVLLSTSTADQMLNCFAIGDFNNDGKSDICYMEKNGTSLFVLYSDGLSILSPKQVNSFTTLPIISNPVVFTRDLNADKYDDIIINTNSLRHKFFYAPSYNNSVDYHTMFSLGDNIIKGGEYLNIISNNGSEIISASYDGNGNQDYQSNGYFNHSSDMIKEQLITKINDKRNPAVTRIATGLGKTIDIKYANLVEAVNSDYNISGIITPATVFYYNTSTTNYTGSDLFKYKPQIFCVHQIRYSNSQFTSNKNIKYTYNNAIYHTKGRSFLGFEQINYYETPDEIGSPINLAYPTTQWRGGYYKYNFNNSYKVGILTEAATGKFIPIGQNDYWQQLYGLSTYFSKTTYQITFAQRFNNSFFESLDIVNEKDFLNSTESNTQYSYNMQAFGKISNKTIINGWAGNSILTDVTNLTYQLNNGYYKLDVVTNTKTQQAQTPYSRSIKYNYNSSGNLTSTINDPTFGNNALTTTFSNFTPYGQAQSRTINSSDLPAPRNSAVVYDSYGRYVIKNINALNDIEELGIEPKFGNVILRKDATGLVTKYMYDGMGRLKKIEMPSSSICKLTYAYENINNFQYPSSTSAIGIYSILKEESGKPYVKAYYDSEGNILRTEKEALNNNLIFQDNQYNYNFNSSSMLPSGLLLESTAPHYANQSTYIKQQFEFEPLNYRISKQKTKVVNPTSTVPNIFKQYTYSSPSSGFGYNKYKVTITDQLSRILKKEFNSAGQNDVVQNTKGTLNQIANYQYHSCGKILQLNLSGNYPVQIAYSYDLLGHQNQLIDPSAGTIDYTYNTIGELTQQKTPGANGINIYDYTYDVLGRLSTKNGNISGTTTFQYYTSGNGKGQIKQIQSPSGANNTITEYQYDYLNRVTQETKTIGTKTLTNSYDYDLYGNITKRKFPNGFILKQVFDQIGNLTQIKDNSNNSIWSLINENSMGDITQYTYGNGINIQKGFSDLDYLENINFGSLSQQQFDFNPTTGNLTSRFYGNLVSSNFLMEKFTYDGADRLTKSEQVDPSSQSVIQTNNFAYDVLGNITHKDDLGDLYYTNTSQPFIVTSISPAPNVNLKYFNIDYNDLLKPKDILEAAANKEAEIFYGNDEQRIKMTYSVNGTQQYLRYYDKDYDRQEYSSGNFKEWNYIYAPSGLCAVNYNNNGSSQLLYVQTDHLGTPLILTNASQQIVEENSYDSWGKRRNSNDWSYNSISASQYLIRGYTMHEHLDEFDLINMNARLYDPITSRFMKADNEIQDCDNLQNLNRFSYSLNNPLKYVDLTGNEYSDYQDEGWMQYNGFWENFDQSEGERFYSEGNMLPEMGVTVSSPNMKDMKEDDQPQDIEHDDSDDKESDSNLTAATNAMEAIEVAASLGKDAAIIYKQSIDLMSGFGMNTNIQSINILSNISKYAGALATIGSVTGVAIDANNLRNGTQTLAGFSYNTFGTGLSIGVGTAFGPVAGAAVGGGFWAGQQLYDGACYGLGQMAIYFTNLDAGLNSGWGSR